MNDQTYPVQLDYTYDKLDRLVAASSLSRPMAAFGYDAAGNVSTSSPVGSHARVAAPARPVPGPAPAEGAPLPQDAPPPAAQTAGPQAVVTHYPPYRASQTPPKSRSWLWILAALVILFVLCLIALAALALAYYYYMVW